ncbi:MAG: sulfatase-like hydrolase/transferase, partial [Methyloceanibacter sp.]
RMETIDYEVTDAALDFMERTVKDDKPFFLWWNSTRMHVFTHLREEAEGKTGLGIYADGMVEHDAHVGRLLKKLDELGIADNTIVVYSTDNGAETFTWPDGGTTMFRGEKNTSWEGGFRVANFIRWPGVIEPDTILNDVFAHEDMLPTLLAAVGDPDVKEKLLMGMDVDGTTFKVHLDGYNILPYLKGDEAEAPRKEFMYWTDDGDLAALRFNNWKVLFMEQRAHGFDVWQDPFVSLRFPKLENLRMDPFERAEHEAIGYGQWRAERMFALVPAQAFVAKWIESFKEFPPRQKAASFSVDDALQKLVEPKIP